MTTLHIPLSEPLRKFVEEQVAAGGHASPEEYVLQLLRDTHDRAARDHLEELLLEGLNSGEPVEVTDEWWDRKRVALMEQLEESRAEKKPR